MVLVSGEAGIGIVCMNGPAARFAAAGDEVVVTAYADMTPEELGVALDRLREGRAIRQVVVL